MKHHKTHSKKHKEMKVESHLRLCNVSVQVVDPMTYDKRLRIMVNDVPPCSGQYIHFRVGRLTKREVDELTMLYDKYFPTSKPEFLEVGGLYQTDIITECKIDDYYVYGEVEKGTTWDRIVAHIYFVCHSDYCKNYKKKMGLTHKYPYFCPYPFDRGKYQSKEIKPETEWEFVIP